MKVRQDKDLDLQIRDGYINIYYKGNSLLKLMETRDKYCIIIDAKFTGGLMIPPYLSDSFTVDLRRYLNPIMNEHCEKLTVEWTSPRAWVQRKDKIIIDI